MTEAVLQPSNARNWLDAFRRDPTWQTLQDLLTDRVDLGSLDAVDPDDLLLRWANDPEENLTYVVDSALQDLVERRWYRTDENVRLADLTWHRMMRVAASLDQAPQTTSFLWGRRYEGEQRLRALVQNSARDALGWFWAAVSLRQDDDSLVEKWMELCHLVDRTPVFHGRWGLLGLRRAPLDNPELVVAEALHEYARAVVHRVEDGELDMAQADLLVTTEMNAVRRAYPQSPILRDFWYAIFPDTSDPMRDWLRRIFGVDA